ncbi:hypothetical protein QBC46DRAFT_237837, partial [Diplogelasinospora grovesii]
MSALLPVALYGLQVPPGEILVPAEIKFPATIRITMAAIDPTAEPEADGEGKVPSVPRSTLKLIKAPADADDDEDADDYLQALLGGGDDEEDSDDDDEEEEEANGGPSDPSKSKKARQEAAIKKLLEATQEEESDEEMDDADGQAAKSKKGKAKASDEDSDDDSDDEDYDEDEDLDMEEFVICTLDTERNYQQTLDITIAEGEKAFFVVSGTHAVYLTGNYVIPPSDEDDEDEDDEDDDDYDLPPGMDLLADEDDDDMSDELDDIDGTPRIKEIDSDEEEAPKLVDTKKAKNKKRPAEDDAEGLDEMMAKDEKKLSKKQQKKLKNNKGEAVAAEEAKAAKEAKGDKKVQFAKELEQGPTGPAKEKAEKKATGVKVVQGVTIDDRKVGTGRTAKAGDKVGMRYIGKLQNGKVFDSNKKGPPFTFKLGKGEVIKGWDIGVAGMAVGGERRLTIPASLAYGSQSMSGIPANSTLVFDVKLLEINPRSIRLHLLEAHLFQDAELEGLDDMEREAVRAHFYQRESEHLRETRVMKVRSIRALNAPRESPESCLASNFQDATNLYLVMEYMPGGDFLGLLLRENILHESVARFYIAEMIVCVEAAHNLKCIHRDIKPDNFLISASGHLKIGDFGLAFDGHWSHDMAYYNSHRYSLLHKLGINIDGDNRDKAESQNQQSTKKWTEEIAACIKKHNKQDLDDREPLLNWRNRCGNRTSALSVVGTSQYMAPEVIEDKENRLCSTRYLRKDLIITSMAGSTGKKRAIRNCDYAGRYVFPNDAEDIKAHQWFRS